MVLGCRGFWVFQVMGLGCKGFWVFSVKALGFRAWGLGLGVWGFRV